MNTDMVKVRLEPLSVEVLVPRGAELIGSLAEHGVEFPCGGTGVCGGCSVRVLAGSLAINLADRAVFSSAEIESGWRLACQARAQEGLLLHCEQWQMHVLADGSATLRTENTGSALRLIWARQPLLLRWWI
jgi:Na+-transporting NADH:ubiquinone oxidoreductase subunit NqrF